MERCGGDKEGVMEVNVADEEDGEEEGEGEV